MLREGYEDYEYLKKLKDLGDGNFAQNQTAILVTNTYTFNKNASDLYAAREATALRILTLLGSPLSPDTTPPVAPTGVTVQ